MRNEQRRTESPSAVDVRAAAILVLPFALLLGVLGVTTQFGPEQLAAADPLVRLFDGRPWVVPLATLLTVAAWAAHRRPDAIALKRAIAWAAGGAICACAVAGMIRLTVGEHLPGFVPPEESSKPGLLLGLSAGLIEEVVFRLILLPLGYAALRPQLPRSMAIAVTIVVTSLAFAASHELGADTEAFQLRHFATRFAFPGVVMSVLYFKLSPAFIITAHLTGHLVIPLLFH